MIPKECKRLAEVDFPIAVVSKHSAREKSIRHGHPSTLHLWWARRPLAACRAMLMALLLPDPCDPLCPDEFKTSARGTLLNMPGWNTPRMSEQVKSDEGLRKALLDFIGDFANWDNAADKDYLAAARALVKVAHPEETPLVVDPFAGGGSIPLEALRLGCEAFASDLNPVACLILKVMLEDIPREARRRGTEGTESLADELRRVGKEIKGKAEKELAEFYPKDPDGATPIAYLWARTVRCESPNCGAEIPLMRSFWLCKKANRKIALRPLCLRGEITFEIFEPKSEKEVPSGTVTRARATCLCCGSVLPPERVREQLSLQRGGADVVFDSNGMRIGGARLLAVVTLYPGIQGRNYRLPTESDYEAIWKAHKRLKAILDEWEKGGKKGLCPVPDEPLPTKESHRAVGSQLPLYGLTEWGDLFILRQKVMLLKLAEIIGNREALKPFLAVAFNRVAMSAMSCTRWNAVAEKMQHTFGRQALPIVWDFAEVVPIVNAPGNWKSGYEIVTDVIASAPPNSEIAQVQNADACLHPLPSESVNVVFTDPPYYDAIPYSDLSDFFFVWLKRLMPWNPLLRDLFDPNNPLTPKAGEAVQCEKVLDETGRSKDKIFYEETMGKAFFECRRIQREDSICSVVFAHKTTEGWEALLSGMIKAGWTVTGSWPISTEMGTRLNARDTASLSTSIHLVCRPRPEDAPVGDWSEVLRELPKRVGDWMERLQGEGIRGADLVFACIGPALEIFSRYRKVETADGSEVKLAEYLEKVWEVVGRTALEQILGTAEARARNGMAGVLEEDARLTAIFLWTLQTTNGRNGVSIESEDESDEDIEDDDDVDAAPKGKVRGYSLVFDVVRRFAQPLGIILPNWEGRIIETKKGVVRLYSISERAKILFGDAGAHAVADRIESDRVGGSQLSLFTESEIETVPRIKVRGRKKGSQQKISVPDTDLQTKQESTTLDRVHAAMLLQASGRANALRTLLKAEQERGSDFFRLANALSALYPKGSEEKRLIDAMLLAVPR
jgi:adenine-specific DNA methylase